MGNKLQSGAAKDLFQYAEQGVAVVGMDAEEQQVQAALEALNKCYIPLDGLANQRAYMHYCLAYLPSYDSSSMLADDELIEFLDRAKTIKLKQMRSDKPSTPDKSSYERLQEE